MLGISSRGSRSSCSGVSVPQQMQAHGEGENGNTGQQQYDDGHGEEQNGVTKVRDPARAAVRRRQPTGYVG